MLRDAPRNALLSKITRRRATGKGIPDFHPSAPKRLVRAFLRAGTYHAVAEEIGVNVRYVYDLLAHGNEPANPEIREACFLPRKKKHHKPAWVQEAVNNLERLLEEKQRREA